MALCMASKYNCHQAMIHMDSSTPLVGIEPDIERNAACMAHHEGGI